MKKFVCPVCGYVHEAEVMPEGFKCPLCRVPGEKTWAAEHVVGVANGADPRIIEGLRENFNGECSEVGMYLCMARIAHREGYPEIGLYWEKAAWEEAEHAAKFAELLGEDLEPNMKATPRRTWHGVWTASSAQLRASLTWLPALRRTVWMLSTTPFTRWLVTRLAMA